MSWIRVERVGSTNALCRERAEAGAAHGTTVLAREQTAGRGRLGRSWWTEPGDAVLMSVLVRRQMPAARVPLLTLGAAVAIAESIPGLQIKWPNDLLAPDGRKVCGILAEAEFAAGSLAWAIVGVGLNLHGAPDLETATSLDAALPGHGLEVDESARRIRGGLLELVEVIARDPGAVCDRWRVRAHTLGRRVRVGEVEGIAEDIDATGALRIRQGERVTTVRAGDVHLA